MSNKSIEEFVKSQTKEIKIKAPKTVSLKPAKEKGRKAADPKGQAVKVKMSAYVPAEVRDRLAAVRFKYCRRTVNDLVLEGIMMVLKKYEN